MTNILGKIFALTLLLVASVFAQDNPQDPAVQAEMTKGHQAMAAHKFQDAEKAFKQATKLSHNTCHVCYIALAGAEWKLGDDRKAAEACDRAIASSTTDAQKAYGHATKGNMFIALGEEKNFKKAEAEYRTALQLDPADAALHYELGIALLKQSKDGDGEHEMEIYLQAAPSGDWSTKAQQFIQNPRRARERYAPELSATTFRGEHISLKDYAGKIVVLDFWATWCPPCVASVPDLKELLKKYPSQNLVLISISADRSEEPWRNFIEKKEMNWTHIYDKDHTICEAFNVHAFPTYMVVDGEGVIRETIVGNNTSRSLAGELKDTLKKMPELKQ